ncbi:MAG: hypothetical protein MRY83_11525 [Flavobacteriales bacterium]|nr:hypothetical protein [Flavobacteriales bacterium]
MKILKHIILILLLCGFSNLITAQSDKWQWNFEAGNPEIKSFKIVFDKVPSDKVNDKSYQRTISEASFKKLDSITSKDPGALIHFGKSSFNVSHSFNDAMTKNNSGHISIPSSFQGKSNKTYANMLNTKELHMDYSGDLPKNTTIANGRNFILKLPYENGQFDGSLWRYYTYNRTTKKLTIKKIVLTKLFKPEVLATYDVASTKWSFGPQKASCNFVQEPEKKPSLISHRGPMLSGLISRDVPEIKISRARGFIYLNGKVNCQGELTNLKIQDKSIGLEKYHDQVVTSLQKLNLKWTPGEKQGQKVETMVSIEVSANAGRLMVLTK